MVLSGCKENIEKKIGSKGRDCKNNKNCEIVIMQLTNFKWEKMFFFDSSANLEVINKALGLDYSDYYKGYTRTIIFLNGNKIVHYENNRADAESVIDGQVIFDYPDSLKSQVYTPKNAKFRITSKTFGDKAYYQLTFSPN
jgi:hypothetical protein